MAWKQVKANRGAAGVDGVCIDEFPERFRERWSKIREELMKGTYVPEPGRRVAIDLDLSKFFDRLARKVSERRVLRLVGKYLRAGVMVEKRLQRACERVPQGGPLSPLLQYMRGWIGYYGIAEGYGFCCKLDSWIRRRIRCCYWKQWYRGRRTTAQRTKNDPKPDS